MVPAGAGLQLYQGTPPTAATPVQCFQNGNLPVEVVRVMITAGATGATAKIYHDDDGTTRNAGTLIWQAAIAANGMAEWEAGGGVGTGIFVDKAGEFAVESSVDAELTFTVYGITAARTQQR